MKATEINTLLLTTEPGATVTLSLENGATIVADLGSAEEHTDDWFGEELRSYEIPLDADLRASDPTPAWLRNASALVGASRVGDGTYDRPEVEADPDDLAGTIARSDYDGPYEVMQVDWDDE